MESSELRRRNQGDVGPAPSPNNNSLLLIDYLVEHGGKVFAETRVRCFTRHKNFDFRVQDSCTVPVPSIGRSLTRRAEHGRQWEADFRLPVGSRRVPWQ